MKLIFCFDGTCNSPETFDDYLEDTSITNILKLHAMFGGTLRTSNDDETKLKQKSFYYSGVGTRGNKLWQTINALIAPSYGDFDTILGAAHDDLSDEVGDDDKNNYEIYIFGFSRGAAIARMFASTLQAKSYGVRFLGVFDTVAATRGSLDLSPDTFPASGILFEDGTLGKHIDEAVHLVALDEKRVLFQPTLFNKSKKVTEVWFAGVHSDVGGGYWFDGLSDLALQFMIDKAKVADLTVHDVKDIDYTKLKCRNTVDTICADDIVVNPLHCGKIHLQTINGYVDKIRLVARSPRVNDNDQAAVGELPIIHHSVVKRFNDVMNYRPYALRDLKYRVLEEDDSTSTPKKGIAELGSAS